LYSLSLAAASASGGRWVTWGGCTGSVGLLLGVLSCSWTGLDQLGNEVEITFTDPEVRAKAAILNMTGRTQEALVAMPKLISLIRPNSLLKVKEVL
jgi:hypothetical protein